MSTPEDRILHAVEQLEIDTGLVRRFRFGTEAEQVPTESGPVPTVAGIVKEARDKIDEMEPEPGPPGDKGDKGDKGDPAGTIYLDLEDAIERTSEGELFWVVSQNDSDVLELWLHDTGGVSVDTGKRTPSDAALRKRVTAVPDIPTLLALEGVEDGQVFEVGGYHPGTNVGGGTLYWDAGSTETANSGTVLEADAGGVGRFKRYEAPSLPAEAFGVLPGSAPDVSYNTARMQAAWDYSSSTGTEITFLSDSLSSPYFVSKLFLRPGMTLRGSKDKTAIQLPTSLWGAEGFFIDREDDGVRYLRGNVRDITFCTATSSVGNAQDANPDLAGAAHVACESWEWSNVAFFGFGQGGLVLARAEGGNEGLGYTATTQDGNYNNFYHVRAGACGRYRSDEQSRAGVVLLYKANSNNFYGVYSRGNPGSSTISIVHGGNNSVFGGTGESLEYSVRLGRMAANNHVFGMRGEGVDYLVRGYTYEGVTDANGPRAWNTIYGSHLSSGIDELLGDEGNNVWQIGTLRSPLSFFRKLSVSGATVADGLIKVLGMKCEDVDGEPVYIMSTAEDGRTTNGAQYVPRLRFRNNHLAPTSGQVLAEIEVENRDNSTGAAGVSARIRAVASGAAGQTDLVFFTGTGSTAAERLRIRSSGVVNISGMPTSAAGLSSGDLWNDDGIVKIV